MLRRFFVLWVTIAGVCAADTLAGKVVEDHSNRPLASVELRVYFTGQRLLAAELETDSEGRFSAAGLPPGEYRIEAAKANYIGASVRRSGLSANLVIRLVRCGVISGVVQDADGRPVRGATVYAMSKPPDGGPPRALANSGYKVFTMVNERGQYRIINLAPGEYVVAVAYGASAAIFGSTGGGAARAGIGSGVQFYPVSARPQIFQVAGGEEFRNIDFALQGGARFSVTGKVDLPAPKTKYWLALTTAEQSSLAYAVASTEEDGSFRFEGIESGNYNLTAAGPTRGYGGRAMLDPQPLFGRTRISVGGANLDGVSVGLQKGRPLSFLLRSTGSPQQGACPPNATVTLNPIEDWAAALERTAELNFQKPQSIEQIAPARFEVVVTRIGESCYQPAPLLLDLTAGAPDSPIAVLVAPAGAIHGKLVGTPRPIDYAVALVPAEVSADPQAVQVVFPGEDGKFAFGNLRPGPYRIAAQPVAEGKARWVADRARMIEIQILAGAPTNMELPAPPESKP